MFFRHHWVIQRIILEVIFNDGPRQALAFRNAQPLRKRPGGDIAHHDLKRDDLHLPDQLLTHIEPADEMRRDADFSEAHHQVFADAVIEHTLAGDGALLLRVEGGGVILEILHQGAGFRPLEQDFCFTFIELAATSHGSVILWPKQPWATRDKTCHYSSPRPKGLLCGQRCPRQHAIRKGMRAAKVTAGVRHGRYRRLIEPRGNRRDAR